MSQASVTFELGNESVTSVLDIDLPTSTPLVGDVFGTFGDCLVAGDLNLTGNLFIEGLMTGIDTFHVQGNGFTIFFENGGRADLHGKFKAPWGPWGTDTTGWVAGDRIGVAPTKVGAFVPSVVAWSDWSMTRPTNSLDATLIDGSVRKPEVVNLGQSIVFENLARGFHIHGSGGMQSLSDVKFLNCGTVGVLGNYPHHFHMVGENARGSLLERVVVEGGQNHAFVPHGSHGITYKDCVAFNTISDAYWWDPPTSGSNPSEFDPNNSSDILFDHCLAGWVKPIPGTSAARLTGFHLGRGDEASNVCRHSTAFGVQGGKNSSGFLWPEGAGSVWMFEDCVAHNNVSDGIFVWQNSGHAPHNIDRFVGYRNGKNQIEHGAYTNSYQYRGLVLDGGKNAIRLHARADPDREFLFEDVASSMRLYKTLGQADADAWTIFRRCPFPLVEYNELANNGENFSWIRFEDCGLVPADFTLTTIHPQSLIEIVEGGVLAHQWAGSWT